jgi:hypothetical protein
MPQLTPQTFSTRRGAALLLRAALRFVRHGRSAPIVDMGSIRRAALASTRTPGARGLGVLLAAYRPRSRTARRPHSATAPAERGRRARGWRSRSFGRGPCERSRAPRRVDGARPCPASWPCGHRGGGDQRQEETGGRLRSAASRRRLRGCGGIPGRRSHINTGRPPWLRAVRKRPVLSRLKVRHAQPGLEADVLGEQEGGVFEPGLEVGQSMAWTCGL